MNFETPLPIGTWDLYLYKDYIVAAYQEMYTNRLTVRVLGRSFSPMPHVEYPFREKPVPELIAATVENQISSGKIQ